MKTFAGLNGHQILAALNEQLEHSKLKLNSAAARKDWPAEYRRDQRREALAEIQMVTGEARMAFATWAQEETADARRRYSADPVGSAADESRRVANELRIARLIDTARRQDERTGPQFVDGRKIESPAGQQLVEQATSAYLDGDYEAAQAFAEAAQALGVQAGGKIKRLAQDQLDQDNPTRRQALKDLAEVDRGLATLEITVQGALASAFATAAQAAEEIGDDPRDLRKAAVGPSLSAKLAAYALAAQTGTDYVEPAGALASSPAAPLHQTGDQLAARVGQVR